VSYGQRMEPRKPWGGCLVVAIVAVGFVVVLSAIVSCRVVRSYRDKIQFEYANQAERMAVTYARVAGRWWVRDDREMMSEAARLLVAGSARFVQVRIGGALWLDLRDPEMTDATLVARDVEDQAGSPHVERSPTGARYLDLIVPIAVAGIDSPIGDVRIGFGLASVDDRARVRAWGAAGVAAGSDVLLIGTVLGFLVFRQRKDRQAGALEPRERQGALIRGVLTIDHLSRTVTISGRLVDLTPKQYALLSLLAEVPDRVLGNDEILRALWPDSPYADSADVKQCVYTLRRRLDEVIRSPATVVVNVKGHGYKLVVPQDEDDPELTGT